MKKMFSQILLLSGIWVIFLSLSARAGECVNDETEFFVSRLKSGQKLEAGDFDILFCYRAELTDWRDGNEYFKGEVAMKKVRNYRSMDDGTAQKKLPPLLLQSLHHYQDSERCDIVRLLAFFGERSVFDDMIACAEAREPLDGRASDALIFAVLGDSHASPWIIRQYQKVDQIFRTQPEAAYPYKRIYLNALYHLPSRDSLQFLEGIISGPEPKVLREWAFKVKQRALSLETGD